MIRLCLAVAVMLLTSTAHAADVAYRWTDVNSGSIHIFGGISADDAGKFMRWADRKNWPVGLKYPDHVQVELDSLGGDLRAAFFIGDEIRRNQWDTVVFTGVKCQSACALIWLAGRYRYFESGALIGFHQPINSANRFTTEKPMSEEWAQHTRAYIDRNGYSKDVADFALSAPPSSIRYLNRDDVQRLEMSKVVEFNRRTNFLREYLPNGVYFPK